MRTPRKFRALGRGPAVALLVSLAAVTVALLPVAPARAAAPVPTSDVTPTSSATPIGQSGAQRTWTGTWATAQHAAYDPGTSEVSVRIPVHVSAGGSRVRIRLTNGFTTEPVTIGHATIGRRAGGANVVSPVDLHFAGASPVTIAAGEQATSDPVRLAVPALSDLVISLYFPGRLTHVSQHWMGLQTDYWTANNGGDHAGDADGAAFTTTDSTFPFLTGVDVSGSDAGGAVVALGDSITDGAASTANTNRRWPDYLATRLSACTTTAGVLNEGISGNRITASTDGNPSALDRLQRDVLSQPNARTVLLFEGVNDLSWGGATADQVIAGMTDIAAQAHALGLRMVGATVVPYRGWGDWWTEAKEVDRQKVNAFVRDSGGVFDAFADFDQAVRDPDDATRYAAAFDSGDHLHPNDVGLKAMADSIDLTTLGAAGDCPTARVRLTPYRPSLTPGTGTKLTATITNTARTSTVSTSAASTSAASTSAAPAGSSAVTGLATQLNLPAGWSAEPAGGIRTPTLAPGASAVLTWTVTPPADTVWGTDPVGVSTSYRQGGRLRHDADSVDATVTPAPTSVQPPYLTTATTTDAQYAQSGGQFAIWAGGADLSGWKDEKAAVYLHQAVAESGTVTARVAGQTGSGPAAKAGIAVANDLTAPQQGGYAVLTMSAQFGLEFMTDSDGDGVLDTWAGGGASYHPAWLKLVRSGTSYTASASADGVAWQQVGAATVPSATGSADAGLVASAVNANYPGQITTALFDSFAVTT